jgi:hypothetical protein
MGSALGVQAHGGRWPERGGALGWRRDWLTKDNISCIFYHCRKGTGHCDRHCDMTELVSVEQLPQLAGLCQQDVAEGSW